MSRALPVLVAPELEADRQRHPHRHGLRAAAGGLEAPALNGGDRRAVEILMARGPFHSDLVDGALRGDLEAKHARTLDSGAARRLGIHGLHLVATPGNGE